MNTKKINAIVFSVLIICISFNLYTPSVEAAGGTDTCEKTKDGHYCIPSANGFNSYGGCEVGKLRTGQISDQVVNCKVGTCVPKGDGPCMANVAKIQCEAQQGEWFTTSVAQTPLCQTGCCNIANSMCNIVQKKVCLDLSNQDTSAFKWIGTNEKKCNDECAGEDTGCCKSTDGLKYTLRSKCTGEFFKNKYCNAIVGFKGDKHAYISQGDGTTNDDKLDCYYYDSLGNREEKVKVSADGKTKTLGEGCGYPNAICKDSDGAYGKDAVCGSTACVEQNGATYPASFKTGESVCSNVQPSFFLDNKKSKTLSNQLFHCQWGEITVSQDSTRENKCVENTPDQNNLIHAKFADNEWEKCASCGEGGWSDIFGFIPLIGPPAAGLLSGGAICDGKNMYWSLGLGENCNERGDCGRAFTTGTLTYDDYDADLIWNPMGSCNPKYPPGNEDKCGECGEGGDAVTNACTREECNHLGNCQFKKDNIAGIGTAAGVAIGTCTAVFAGVEIYCALMKDPVSTSICASKTPHKAAAKTCISLNKGTLFTWAIASIVLGVSGAVSANEATPTDYSYMKAENGAIKLGDAISFGLIVQNQIKQGTTKSTLTTAEQKKLEGYDQSPVALATGFGLGSFATIAASYIYKSTATLSWLFLSPGATSMLASALAYAGMALGIITVGASMDTGKCSEEKAYTNNEHCDECGTNEGQFYCTKARCGILGGGNDPVTNPLHCRWIQKDQATDDGYCIAIESKDATPPELSSLKATFKNIKGEPIKTASGTNKITINEQLSWQTKEVEITMTTEEYSECKYYLAAQTAYDQMQPFDESNFESTHKTNYTFTEADKIPHPEPLKIYIKCMDLSNNIHTSDDNYISIKFEKRPDTAQPIIKYIDPQIPYLPEAKGKVTVNILAYDENRVNECKYSATKPNFDEMDKTFTSNGKVQCPDTNAQDDCDSFSSEEISLAGGTLLNNSALGLTAPTGTEGIPNLRVHMMYISCKDGKNNIMDTLNWTLIVVPQFGLTITSPTGSGYERNPTVNATTKQAAICNYTIGSKEYVLSDNFGYDHLTTHETSLDPGTYTINFECKDIAGNIAINKTDYTVLVDSVPPYITRAYTRNSLLYVHTNEKASCNYSPTKTPTKFDQADLTEMLTDDKGIIHRASGDDSMYKIICQDAFQNNSTITTIYI